MNKAAVISKCECYRYWLQRRWSDEPRALFVMLNPSTADAEVDDATIRSCIRLCKYWGYGTLEVVNLFALRATDPKELRKADDPVGPRNDHHIWLAMAKCDAVVCAWGAHDMVGERAEAVHRQALEYHDRALCLGKTKAGHPRHPLYVRTGTPLIDY